MRIREGGAGSRDGGVKGMSKVEGMVSMASSYFWDDDGGGCEEETEESVAGGDTGSGGSDLDSIETDRRRDGGSGGRGGTGRWRCCAPNARSRSFSRELESRCVVDWESDRDGGELPGELSLVVSL